MMTRSDSTPTYQGRTQGDETGQNPSHLVLCDVAIEIFSKEGDDFGMEREVKSAEGKVDAKESDSTRVSTRHAIGSVEFNCTGRTWLANT